MLSVDIWHPIGMFEKIDCYWRIGNRSKTRATNECKSNWKIFFYSISFYKMNHEILIENFVNNRNETSVQQLGECMLRKKKLDRLILKNSISSFSVDSKRITSRWFHWSNRVKSPNDWSFFYYFFPLAITCKVQN